MPVVNGDVFVVKSPYTENNSVIFGRNSFESDVHEIIYYEGKTENFGLQKCNTIEIEASTSLSIIISKSFDLSYGCESGANSKCVTIGLIWAENEKNDDSILQSTDLVRLGLERGNTSEEALDVITFLNDKYGSQAESKDSPKYSFLICDAEDAWLLNIVGKFWAAEKIDGFRSISIGLGITTKVDKTSTDLKENLKNLGYWDDSMEFNFSSIFAPNQSDNGTWFDTEPLEGTFNISNMLDLLRRDRDHSKIAQTSQASVLTSSGISNHWFTATSNPKESVFKPFVFTSQPKISPLTKINDNDTVTLLHKLHSQRSWKAIGELLQSLEETCVREIQGYLLEKAGPGNPELDELMKDCVEAEVKFYR